MNEYTKQSIKNLRDDLTNTIANTSHRLELLSLIASKLTDFPHDLSFSFGYKTIDIDNLNREVALELITFLGLGKWDKELSCSTSISYISQQEFMGYKIRLYAVPPPESCKLVEIDVEVPATPARVEKRYKLVCNKADAQTQDLSDIPDLTLV